MNSRITAVDSKESLNSNSREQPGLLLPTLSGEAGGDDNPCPNLSTICRQIQCRRVVGYTANPGGSLAAWSPIPSRFLVSRIAWALWRGVHLDSFTLRTPSAPATRRRRVSSHRLGGYSTTSLWLAGFVLSVWDQLVPLLPDVNNCTQIRKRRWRKPERRTAGLRIFDCWVLTAVLLRRFRATCYGNNQSRGFAPVKSWGCA